jgi:hypothetical protein
MTCLPTSVQHALLVLMWVGDVCFGCFDESLSSSGVLIVQRFDVVDVVLDLVDLGLDAKATDLHADVVYRGLIFCEFFQRRIELLFTAPFGSVLPTVASANAWKTFVPP